MTMASRMAVMSKGRIVQEGKPAEIYETPKNRFVADFIGAVNLFEGRVATSINGILAVECPELGARLSVSHDGTLAAGTAVAIAVRPEKIALVAGAAPDLSNRLQGTVRDIAYRGEASTYHVTLARGRALRVTLPNRSRFAGETVAPGASVWLAWDEAAGIVLPS